MQAATEFRIPVVPRGAGTGLAGGANGTDGAIVLSVAGMDRILEIVREDELAVVEPGVINADLNAALRPHGLWFAPDPASKAISSVGGNIATNAGGLLCAKYGVTREAVLGLSVVLADGRLIRTGHRTVKGVTGFDLTALFVGSEGTLGVIVGRDRPRRSRFRSAASRRSVRCSRMCGRAAAASARVTASRLRPAVMELLDGPSLERIAAHLGAETIEAAMGASGGAAFLLVQFDGLASATDAAAASELIRASGGTVRVSTDAAEGERLLAIRRAFHPALEAHGNVLIEDVSVPRSRMPEMFEAIERIGEQVRHRHPDGRARRRRQPAPQLRRSRATTFPTRSGMRRASCSARRSSSAAR